jgi:hypothetical protein
LLLLGLVTACGNGGENAPSAPAADAGPTDQGGIDAPVTPADGTIARDAGDGASPILVSAMLHIDPLPWFGGEAQMLEAYPGHRQAIQWYLQLAAQTGLTISAQMTGLYAEACVGQGHEADFVDFMPGGPHHLGTHLHAHVHGEQPYEWRELAEEARRDPQQVARVFADQIPWVNRVFEGAGATAADNWLFHGTHASYRGMAGPLLQQDGSLELPYDNVYRACGALRGITYLHRGTCYAKPEGEGAFVKIPEVGGIIGEDREHGPEGMVYGSLPYQRRDFLRVYLDWREGVRRGAPQGVRHFNWMIHPYQLIPRYRASDGRNPRETIVELVAWLAEHFVDHADDTGQIVARFASTAQMVETYLQWEQQQPEAAAAQSAGAEQRLVQYLPAIHQRLESTYHDRALDLDPSVVAHRFVDRDSNGAVFVLFARGAPVSLQLGGELPAAAQLLRGDGSRDNAEGELVVGAEPLIVEAR